MLTPITCLTLVCDGCGTPAGTPDEGPFHFDTLAAARDWLGPDPEHRPDLDDDAYTGPRWAFLPDGTHRCPACQCTTHGHRPGPVRYAAATTDRPALLHASCDRCRSSIHVVLDLTPADVDAAGGPDAGPVTS